MKQWVDQHELRARTKQSWRRWLFGGSAKDEKFIVDTGFHWGEWWRPGGLGPWTAFKDLFLLPNVAIPTAYFTIGCRTLSMAASKLDHEEDASYYKSLFERVTQVWNKSFVRQNGSRIGDDYQDDYVRAVKFSLIPEEQHAAALARLAELVRDNDYHLGTGFLSTGLLLPALCNAEYTDEAFKVLLQTSSPSWLNAIELGATSIWETWEGYNAKGEATTSHNHYSLGSVSGWFIEGLAGLSRASPGWRHILIAPQVAGTLTHASGSVFTPYGKLSSSWKKIGKEVTLEITIPAGTTAQVRLGAKTFEDVGSGSHKFSAVLDVYFRYAVVADFSVCIVQLR